jgi:hypothetical protein
MFLPGNGKWIHLRKSCIWADISAVLKFILPILSATNGEDLPMRTLLTLAALMAFGLNLQSAQAGFLGMPLNLKAAIERVELNGSTPLSNPSSEFRLDDLLTGPWLISCWQASLFEAWGGNPEITAELSRLPTKRELACPRPD